MKAIVLAAGMGSRLGEHTKDKPKCLVPLNGKPLLEYQLEVLRTIADDIVIVRGYMGQLINYPDVRYVENPEYATTNMVGSLMAARSELEGDCLLCYSDIVYEPRVLECMRDTKCSIGVAVDIDFQEYWKTRLGNVQSDSESLQLNEQGQITELGRPQPAENEMDARYIGLLKFDSNGTEAFKEVHDKHEQSQSGKSDRWYNSRSFRQAYMTDMIQATIDEGVNVQAIKVQRGWIEMDTEEDFRIYHEWIRSGMMRKFCDLFGS